MLTECPQCTTRFAADLAFCPHCGWIVPEEEETVPKINDRGPSYRAAELAGEDGPWSQQEQDGKPSEESQQSDENLSSEGTESQSPAPTTESRSDSTAADDSSARTTDGGRTTGRATKATGTRAQGTSRPQAGGR